MDPVRILRALDLLASVLNAASQAAATFNTTIATARSEGRDLTDAELDALSQQTDAALADFKKKAGL